MRGEVRLGFLLYRSWGENMEGLKKMGEKGSSNTHSCTVVPVPVSLVLVPKVYYLFFVIGTGTTLLPYWFRHHFAIATFSLMGTGTKSVVPVSLCYCLVFQPWYKYQFTKISRILYILDFIVCSLLALLHTPSKLTCAC